jgi:hypothetical protein
MNKLHTSVTCNQILQSKQHHLSLCRNWFCLLFWCTNINTHTQGQPIFFKSSYYLLKCTYNMHSDPAYRHNLMSKNWMPTKLHSKYTLSLRRIMFTKATNTRKTENLIIQAQKWREWPQILATFSKFRNCTALFQQNEIHMEALIIYNLMLH